LTPVRSAPGAPWHSHSDTLAVVVRSQGQDVLIDPGAYTYTADAEMRRWFRSSAAHNTVRVDGCDQADQDGPFGWRGRPETRIEEARTAAAAAICEYAAPGGRVRHRRRIEAHAGRLVIEDEVDGPPGEHVCEAFWHPAGEAAALSPGEFRVAPAVALRTDPHAVVEPGWRSPAYGRKEEASVVVVRRRGAFPMKFRAVLEVLDDGPAAGGGDVGEGTGIGGCERDLSRVARHLDRSRFAPHVGCFIDQGLRAAEIREAGLPVVRFPVRSFRNASFWRGLRELQAYTAEHAIGLVHAFDMPTDVFAAALRVFPKRPRVLLSHLWLRDCTRPRVNQKLLRLTDFVGDAFVVNSAAAREEMIRRFGRPADRVFLCYNGVDTRVFHPRGRARRAGLEGARAVIGTVCALRPEKRLEVLVEAFARLSPARRGLALVIVGGGAERGRLEELARRLGVGGQCRFEPATGDVAPWLRSIDIYVLPSESESFPNSLVEAMACGCAVAASRVGGIPEMIEHGRNGLLVPPGDAAALAAALERLVESPGERANMAAAAAGAGRRFSLERNLARTEEIYGALLEGRLPPALPSSDEP
jgi:glycosyltransferase involved in cell wall biosynthesis